MKILMVILTAFKHLNAFLYHLFQDGPSSKQDKYKADQTSSELDEKHSGKDGNYDS